MTAKPYNSNQRLERLKVARKRYHARAFNAFQGFDEARQRMFALEESYRKLQRIYHRLDREIALEEKLTKVKPAKKAKKPTTKSSTITWAMIEKSLKGLSPSARENVINKYQKLLAKEKTND